MIQRIQTVYLVVGAVALLALAATDRFWNSQAAETLVWFLPLLVAMWAVSIVLALVSVFLYTNRSRQERLVVITQLTTLAFMVVLYGGLYLGDQLIVMSDQGAEAGRLLQLILPIAAYVFFFLARRAIRRDIALVRSMDRLR